MILHISATSKIRIVLFIMAILLGGALKSLASRYWFVQSNTVLYGTLVVAWSMTIQSRILDRTTRYSLVAVGMMILALLLLRGCKNVYFAEVNGLWQYFWYAYYPAYLGISLFCFYAAASLSDRLRVHMDKLYSLLVPGTILSLLILTNDIHHLAFRFLPGTLPNDGAYTYGPAFFMAIAWAVVFLASTIILIYRQCRMPHIRRYVGIPFLILLLFGLYFLWDLILGYREFVWDIPRFFERPEMFCFMIMGFWEACIQIGLVQSNSEYEKIMHISDISAIFLNDDNSEALVSENAYIPGEVDVEAVQAEPVRLDEDTILYGHKLEGGGVLWTEDIHVVNRLNEELAETAERLSEENMLLEAENAWQEQQISYEVQDRLYDSINQLVTPQLQEIRRLTEEARALEKEPDTPQNRALLRTKLSRMAFLGAYVKRRANLTLVAESEGDALAEELYLSIKESLEYLRLQHIAAGVVGDSENAARAFLSREQVFLCYDYFQYTMEQALPGLTAVQVTMNCRDHFQLRMEMDNASALPEKHISEDELERIGGRLTIQTEDETSYVTLEFPETAAEREKTGNDGRAAAGKEAGHAVR